MLNYHQKETRNIEPDNLQEKSYGVVAEQQVIWFFYGVKIMSRLKNVNDIMGNRYGRLEVVKYIGREKGMHVYSCICDCGTGIYVKRDYIISGDKKSCGCLYLENCKSVNKTHGKTKSPEYKSWQKMKERCYYKKSNRYLHYGARGIKVCDRWVNSFENFLEDMGKRPAKTSLDRLDVNEDYSPENCRWATSKQQARNTRRNTFIEYNGQNKTISEWAELYGIDAYVLSGRIRLNWEFHKALLTPVKRKGNKK
jgi:hypothetical protein